MTTSTLNMSLPIGSLDAYIARVNAIPLLTDQEEIDLATSLQNENDLAAAKRLVMSHLRFVVKVARGYSGYGLSQADLIQEGNIGLMKAVKRFDPTIGVRLVSFAIHWIKAEIHEFVLRNWRIVKVATTKAQRKLFFNLRKATAKLLCLTNEQTKEVADNLNVKESDVRTMEMRMKGYDQSFDPVSYDDDDEKFTAPATYLEDHRYDPARLMENYDWDKQQKNQLTQAISSLDERTQDILQQRWLAEKKATLHDLAAKYDVSAERIRQLEANALKKLRQHITSNELH